ncbi:hypothetical protein CYOC110262_12535 [Cytobacillus oceanisediminis]|uniref:Uncharacterized protein n=1 Tax=Cytobacillus oceanisediminis TaxID=665099 RepID=A0A562JGB2_9BACI|nr:hypothetical protein IQ19_04087 [Cytobacillus oceanisediminis]
MVFFRFIVSFFKDYRATFNFYITFIIYRSTFLFYARLPGLIGFFPTQRKKPSLSETALLLYNQLMTRWPAAFISRFMMAWPTPSFGNISLKIISASVLLKCLKALYSELATVSRNSRCPQANT